MSVRSEKRPAPTIEDLAAIAVPLDGSFASERAMQHAIWLARRAGVPLRLVGLSDEDEMPRNMMSRYLGEVAASVPGCVVVDTVVPPDVGAVAAESRFIAGIPSDGVTVCTAIPVCNGELVHVADRPVVVVGPRVVPLDAHTAPEIVAYLDEPEAHDRVKRVASAWGATLALPWRVDLARYGPPGRTGARLVVASAPRLESPPSAFDAVRGLVLDAASPVLLVPAA